MENKRKIWGLSALALTGLALALKLVYIYYIMNFLHSSEPSFCVLNDVIDCDAVAKTSSAAFLGVPLALYGVFLYCFVLFLCFVDKLQNIKFLSILKVFKNPVAYICSLYTISFTISICLLFVQFFEIHKFCLLCCLTYIVDLVSLLYAKDYKQSIFYEIKVSVMDFVEAIKNKLNLVLFLLVVMLVSGALCYANSSFILTPQLKNGKEYFDNLKNNPFKIHGNVLGDEKATVIVTEYSDFECPMCKVMNKMLQKITTEYDNILVIHNNYPLDMACNPALTVPIHMNACKYAKFALAAKEQNKYWEMINILFEYQPKSNKQVAKLAEKNGIDSFRLVNDYIGMKVENEMIKEINSGLQKRINATPTIYINGEKFIGAMEYDELTKILVKKGAVLKSKEK